MNSRKIVYKYKLIGRIFGYFAKEFQFKLLSFYKETRIVKLIKSIMREVDFAFFPYEAFMVFSIARSQTNTNGDMVEVGVYQGGSAKLICEAKGSKKLYLFDTFEGLPTLSSYDTHFGMSFWEKNQFSNTSFEKVKNYLSSYNDVHIYKGEFPDTAESIKDSKFSFVHLDVDLYKSTKDCLEFFYPRMMIGGIILIHD